MEAIVKAKTLSDKAASKSLDSKNISIIDREKLEEYQRQDKLNAKEAKLKSDFLAMDADGDGTVSVEEMGKILRAMKTKLRMSETEIKRTLKEFDMDGNGEIEVSEFLYCMENSKKKDLIHRAILQHSHIHREFKQFDVDGNGYITKEEFFQVYQHRTGMRPSEEIFRNMLKSVDFNGDDQISYDEFLHMLLNTPYKIVM